MENQTTLRIGFIGTGFNAQFHVRSLLHVRNCIVTAIVGRSATKEDTPSSGATTPSESAKELQTLVRSLRLGDPIIFDSAKELASSSLVDAIWITAPNFTRVSTIEAIVEGKIVNY